MKAWAEAETIDEKTWNAARDRIIELEEALRHLLMSWAEGDAKESAQAAIHAARILRNEKAEQEPRPWPAPDAL